MIVIPFDFYANSDTMLFLYSKACLFSSYLYQKITKDDASRLIEDLYKENLYEKNKYYITEVRYEYDQVFINYTLTMFMEILLNILPDKGLIKIKDSINSLRTVNTVAYIYLGTLDKKDIKGWMVLIPEMKDYNKVLEFVKQNYPEVLYI